jgi:hypothetical protein
MNEAQENESRTLCQSWLQMVTSLFGCPWKLYASQYQLGLKLMEGVFSIPAGAHAGSAAWLESAARGGDALRAFEHQAAERMRQGLAPPKEIYEAPYRDQIDWSRFPDWARPSDPELFQGCGHEG